MYVRRIPAIAVLLAAVLFVISPPFVGEGIFAEQLQTKSATSPATDYHIDWWSVNSGGGEMSNAGYKLASSAAQSAVGQVIGGGYRLEQGYWSGAEMASACDCGVWGDITGDGMIGPPDVVMITNLVYKGIDFRVQPPNCPRDAGDVTCDNATNPSDVVAYVSYVYKGLTAAFCADPCGP